ncbi:SHOCT domain-containing protein [Nocardiopsis lambiniae]|uniref:SHOCT domain-containing protein n=1 Tax=Nocardiopsis lambiniae TaxID=3075539 RepID=A0ABU2MFV1_9ACTN|nr:SHOCT domain-containing protein [Nocardiopsis sp. DSM 44743]MDT0331577.1 SHOCT domain-containing protein [Nocardiopsis sp. DSM 44743]
MTAFFATIVILVMVALGTYLVITVAAGSTAGKVAPPDRTPPGVDRAQEELRLRYARGEIGREEYLQRKIDLE